MKCNYLLVTAISLAMASAAVAQSSSGSTSGGTSGSASGTTSAAPSGGSAGTPGMMEMNEAQRSTMSNWPEPIRNALFSDASGSTLRSQDEIKANWSKLTAEQQNQVKQDCNTMQTASAGGTAGASGGASGSTTAPKVSGETTASTTTGSTSSGTTAGTSGGASATGGTMTVAQLCTMVNSM
jgi:hypothetical protein